MSKVFDIIALLIDYGGREKPPKPQKPKPSPREQFLLVLLFGGAAIALCWKDIVNGIYNDPVQVLVFIVVSAAGYFIYKNFKHRFSDEVPPQSQSGSRRDNGGTGNSYKG